MRSVVRAVVAALFVSVFASAASAKLLTFCSPEDPEGFDPAAFTSDATFDASAQTIYSRLVDFAPGTATVIPGLAERWEVSDDGLTWTFHLRPGIAFHTTPDFAPGRLLGADDVVFSFVRQQDPGYSYHAYLGGQWPWFSGLGLDTRIQSVRKTDDLTVAFTLDEPDSGFLATLAMDFASILSREYAEALLEAGTPELLNTRPVGTGPYVFVDYVPGVRVEYRANPTYWRGAPPVDMLVFSITPAPAERLRELKAGACQVMANPDATALAAAASDEALEIVETDRLDLAYLAVNTAKAPFGDVRIRRALGMAIDKRAIVDAVYGGAASAADTVVPPSMWAHNADAAEAAFDPEAAKALLAEAGASNLRLTLLTATIGRPYNPDPERVAKMIAADLAKVGVTVTVVAPELLGEFLRAASDPERDGAVLLGWTSDNGDPGDFLSLLLSCGAVGQSNRAQWCYAPLDDLLADAARTNDPAARARLYAAAQEILAVHQPLTAIAHSVVSVPMAATVTGFAPSPFGRHNFARVDIAE